MPGPLQGIRVVDLSAVMSGPLCATLLADQGAEVIKVEAPGLGDILRWVGSRRNGMSALFHLTNRGKRCIVLDLAQERGREIVRRLVERADVVIQNFRPGVVERMGIGYAELQRVRPGLVYLSISGFGSEGPYAQKRVYDNVIQAYSGFSAVQSDPESGEPQLIRQLICDKLTSYTAAQAVTAALLARERGAGGQHIRVSMLDTAIAFLWPDAASDAALLGDDVQRQPTIGSNYAMMRLADGWGTATPLSDSEFRGLCRAFDHPELTEDPRFATLADRMAHVADLVQVLRNTIGEAAARVSCAEAEARLDAEDVPNGIVRSLEELHRDPQIAANAVLVESEHPLAGRLREPRPAPRFEKTPAGVGGPAPGLGQHTDEILAELGLADEIPALRASRVVG